MGPPIDWLLSGGSFVEYRTRLDLLGQSEKDPAVIAARRAMLADPNVQGLLDGLAEWPGKVIASHKSAGQPFHRLDFAVDLGLTLGDPPLRSVADTILLHQSAEGPFRLPVPASAKGGEADGRWGWALCDAPLQAYALVKLGLEDDPAVVAATDHMIGLTRDNGWPCVVSQEHGGFRGPGRKDDPCPYATLAMLKVLAEIDDRRDGAACRTGCDVLLSLWQDSKAQHPYMFFMGTDFRKLKVPFVWYDLMHVLDILSRFDWLRADARLIDMLSVLKAGMGEGGRFTPQAKWAAWKDWEFGQTAEPSRWLTLCAWRIIGRIEG